eukprot:scaffold5135_cov113-Isochrysis_galbana.AAC.7
MIISPRVGSPRVSTTNPRPRTTGPRTPAENPASSVSARGPSCESPPARRCAAIAMALSRLLDDEALYCGERESSRATVRPTGVLGMLPPLPTAAGAEITAPPRTRARHSLSSSGLPRLRIPGSVWPAPPSPTSTGAGERSVFGGSVTTGPRLVIRYTPPKHRTQPKMKPSAVCSRKPQKSWREGSGEGAVCRGLPEALARGVGGPEPCTPRTRIENGWHREGFGRGREADVSGAGEACAGRLFWGVRSVLAWYTTPPPEMEQSVKVM